MIRLGFLRLNDPRTWLTSNELLFHLVWTPTLFIQRFYQVYELPTWIPPDTHYLISRMLLVDPVKRITVPEILAHPWVRRGMRTYMLDTTLQTAPSLVGTVSTLLAQRDVGIVVEGLGTVDAGVVNELAGSLGAVSILLSFSLKSIRVME